MCRKLFNGRTQTNRSQEAFSFSNLANMRTHPVGGDFPKNTPDVLPATLAESSPSIGLADEEIESRQPNFKTVTWKRSPLAARSALHRRCVARAAA